MYWCTWTTCIGSHEGNLDISTFSTHQFIYLFEKYSVRWRHGLFMQCSWFFVIWPALASHWESILNLKKNFLCRLFVTEEKFQWVFLNSKFIYKRWWVMTIFSARKPSLRTTVICYSVSLYIRRYCYFQSWCTCAQKGSWVRVTREALSVSSISCFANLL